MFRAISKSLQNKSDIELNENPKRINQDIKHIRMWISQQPHLHRILISDQLILNFLRGCKFSLHKTKEKLDNYYAMKVLLPEIYKNRDPFLPEIQDILSRGSNLPLLKTIDEAGPRIIAVRCLSEDPTKMTIINVVKCYMMIIEILLIEDDNFVIAGQQGLIDLTEINVNHMMQLQININFCKKVAMALQHAYPTRPKGFHVVNAPNFFQTIYTLFSPIMPKKIKDRISVYNKNNFEDILKVIPKTLLPKDFGGDGDSLEDLTAYWKKKVESYRDWFLEDEKNCSDEAKRPGKAKVVNNVFGVEGSFRKLEVD